jgi:hypothetical protein
VEPAIVTAVPHDPSSQPAGTKRGQGKGSFVSSVTSLVDQFYAEVAQLLKPVTGPRLLSHPLCKL